MKKVFGNAFSQTTVRLTSSTTTFLVTLLITSYLGIIPFGSFIKITTFVALFYLVVDFGINTVYLRDYFEDIEKHFGNILYFRLLLSFLLFVFVSLFVWLLPTGVNSGFSYFEKLGIILFSLTFFTEAVIFSFSGLVQKKLLQKTLVIPSILSSFSLLIIVYFGIMQSNIFLILLSYPISQVIQILLMLILVRKKILYNLAPNSFPSFSKKTVISAAPLALMLFLNVVYFRVDTFVLSILKSTGEVGSYGFAYKVFEFLIAFPTFLSASIFPILIINKDNKKIFNDKVKTYSIIFLFASIIIGAIVFVLSPVITLIKSDLESAILPLRILCFALPFFFLTSFFQWILLLKKKVALLVFIYALTMIVNIILNVIYIPQFSYNAAAVITVATEGLVFLLMLGILSFKK